MPKYATTRKKYELTRDGLRGKFKTKCQKLTRVGVLDNQLYYNRKEIERAQSRIREIQKERDLLVALASEQTTD